MYGTSHQVGSFLVVNIGNSEIEFGKIENIICVDNEIYFYFEIFEEITFDDHFQAYVVNTNSSESKLINYSD